jgi:hypothetical protein
MPTYRLWTPDDDTYRGTVEAETPAKALLKHHRKTLDDPSESPFSFELGYDPDLDAIVWPNDATRKRLGDVDDWRIEPADDD